MLSVPFSSYCYSDVIGGSTNNAAANGLTWNMNDILPPEAGLSINGLNYQYTINKDPTSDAQVTIQNENALGDGYVFKETDNWNQLPSSTITKMLTFGNIPREAWGDGSIQVDGEASVSDPIVVYNYRFDPCFIPLSNPECPGYKDALYQWLLDNGMLNGDIDIDDPYYNEYVQAALEQEVELEEEEEREEQEESDDERENALFAADKAIKLADGAAQQAMLNALTVVPQFDAYYTLELKGGEYEETLRLEDKNIPDNKRAMRNLAQQELHRNLVRSQYDRTQQTTEN